MFHRAFSRSKPRASAGPKPSPDRAPKTPAGTGAATPGNQARLRILSRPANPQPEAPQVVGEALQSPGRRLDGATRSFFEPLFGRDLSRVRIHTGDLASESARALQARAYTFGSDVVFGPGEYAPHTPGGRLLLAHELTHVVQQDTGAPRQVARQNTSPGSTGSTPAQPGGAGTAGGTSTQTVVPPTTPNFKDVYKDFSTTLAAKDKRPLAIQALNLLSDASDERQYGNDLASYFLREGMEDKAQEALKKAQDGWLVTHVMAAKGPAPVSGNPGILIDRAKEAARAGHHSLAFQLFGLAYQFLQFEAAEAGPQREERAEAELEKNPHAADMSISIGRILSFYPTLTSIYNSMRDILGFYYQLEAEARAATTKTW